MMMMIFFLIRLMTLVRKMALIVITVMKQGLNIPMTRTTAMTIILKKITMIMRKRRLMMMITMTVMMTTITALMAIILKKIVVTMRRRRLMMT